jgi:glucose-6-phosphate dehydrogenase assembly protein OpcA
MTVAEPTILRWKSEDVDLTSVERELSSLWKQLARQQDRTSPVRTHVFNLLVYASSAAEAHEIESSLEHLGDRQPSRTIILYGDRTPGGSAISAEVSLTCPVGSGDRPPRCFERISICASGRAADHLDSVATPLIISELRTYLWWPGQPPFGYRAFHRLLALTDQLVVDSAQFLSPGDGITNVARLSSGHQGVNDFQWARLVSWREIITQFFDGPGHVEYARNMQSIEVEFAGGGGTAHQQYATAGLLLMLGWAGRAFNWQPETTLDGILTSDLELSVVQDSRLIPIHVRFADHGAAAAGRLMRFKLNCGAAHLQNATFTIERTDDLINARVRQEIGSRPVLERVVPLAVRTDIELLVDELELTGHDPLYEDAARCASLLAGRVLWTPT